MHGKWNGNAGPLFVDVKGQCHSGNGVAAVRAEIEARQQGVANSYRWSLAPPSSPTPAPITATTNVTDEALRAAVLQWWDEHQYDTYSQDAGDGYFEEYSVYNEAPHFVRIAMALNEKGWKA